MTSFGVVLAGPKAGQADVDWTPVARALGLDQAAFAAKVLSAMPLLVRRQLDEALATEVADRLAAIGAIAEVVPDRDPFVYIEREGASLGPVPHAALERFIADGERYRLRNTREWQVWQRPVVSLPSDEVEPAPLPEAITEVEPASLSEATTNDVAAELDVPVAFEPPPPPPLPVDASAFPPAWTQPIVEDQASTEPVEAKPPRSSIAAIAGYLGVFSIVPGVGLLAMLAGMLAVRDIHRHPQKQGIGRARFAIAVGAVLSVVWAALFVLRDDIRLPSTSQVNAVTAGQLVADRQAPAVPRPVAAAPVAVTGSPAPAPAASTPATVPSAALSPPATSSSAPAPSAAPVATTLPAPASSEAPAASAHVDPASVAAESAGPSFDCKKSLSMTETVICANKALSALDREQAAAFNKALAQTSGDRATTLREGQAGWQHERNELCGSDTKCIERYMRARLATFAPPPPPKGAAPPSP
ncbi:lysozyme inhibitor LprI family protein [Pinirhizobacter soli]|uniref:lysozyme inhibitor LprI family protein n=1 Tax=Pinirhizobacter soli TaxID=2786953 RepID=UPI00202A0A61